MPFRGRAPDLDVPVTRPVPAQLGLPTILLHLDLPIAVLVHSTTGTHSSDGAVVTIATLTYYIKPGL